MGCLHAKISWMIFLSLWQRQKLSAFDLIDSINMPWEKVRMMRRRKAIAELFFTPHCFLCPWLFLQNPTTVGWCRLRRSLCLNFDSKFSCRRRCCKFASALFSCKGQENVNKEERQFERPRDKNIRNQNVKINSYFSREYNGENKMWKFCKLHKKAKNH